MVRLYRLLYRLHHGLGSGYVLHKHLIARTLKMRRYDVPLLSLETWSPVSSAHVLAVTLQHEFNYTNVLEMLDLGGIPLLSAERDETAPLVVAGGPAGHPRDRRTAAAHGR